MLDLDDHVAGTEERIAQHLAGVETGSARHPGAREDFHDVVLRALRRPALHERIDFTSALPAGLRRLVARVADEVVAADGAKEGMPQLLLGEGEDVLIGSAGLAAIRRARRGDPELVSGSRRGLAVPLMVAETHADEIHDDILHGDLDLLALAGGMALHEGGENPDHAVHPRARVADGRPDEGGRAVRKPGDTHASPHRLGDRLVALVLTVRAVGPEAFDARVDQTRVERLYRRIVEAQAIEDPWAEILEEHVRSFQKCPEDVLGAGMLEVQGKAPLVGVEREEEEAVGVRPVPMGLARDVAPVRFFDLDDVRPQPREHLAAGRARLIVREVDDTDARQGLGHGSRNSIKDTSPGAPRPPAPMKPRARAAPP